MEKLVNEIKYLPQGVCHKPSSKLLHSIATSPIIQNVRLSVFYPSTTAGGFYTPCKTLPLIPFTPALLGGNGLNQLL